MTRAYKLQRRIPSHEERLMRQEGHLYRHKEIISHCCSTMRTRIFLLFVFAASTLHIFFSIDKKSRYDVTWKYSNVYGEKHVRGTHRQRHLAKHFEMSEEVFGRSEGDRFGSSIAITSTGRRFVVGTKYHSLSKQDYGRVEVYDQEKSPISVPVRSTISGDKDTDFFGEAVAISGIGDRIAVAAPYDHSISGTIQGEVRIFDWDNGNWNKSDVINIDIETGLTDNHRNAFHLELSDDGRKLLVSSLYDGTAEEPVGSVRTYTWNGVAWKKVGRLNGKGTNYFFGFALAMTKDGDCLVVGEPMHDNDKLSAGAVAGYTNIYKWHRGNWVRKGQAILGPTAYERSGFSVAISADCSRVVSGAPYNSFGGNHAGRVRVYDFDEGSKKWVQSYSLDGRTNEVFGSSVSLTADGTRLAVGAVGSTPIGKPNLKDPNGANSGYVVIYDWNGIAWEQFGEKLNGIASYDQFGYKVVLSSAGDRIFIASPYRNGLGVLDSGSVKVVRITPNNLLCPKSEREIPSNICKKQQPQVGGALCSSCIQNMDCIGGGVTTYCSFDSFCVPLQQISPGCRCQQKRDCFGFEDGINSCVHKPSEYVKPFATLFPTYEAYCVPNREGVELHG